MTHHCQNSIWIAAVTSIEPQSWRNFDFFFFFFMQPYWKNVYFPQRWQTSTDLCLKSSILLWITVENHQVNDKKVCWIFLSSWIYFVLFSLNIDGNCLFLLLLLLFFSRLAAQFLFVGISRLNRLNLESPHAISAYWTCHIQRWSKMVFRQICTDAPQSSCAGPLCQI